MTGSRPQVTLILVPVGLGVAHYAVLLHKLWTHKHLSKLLHAERRRARRAPACRRLLCLGFAGPHRARYCANFAVDLVAVVVTTAYMLVAVALKVDWGYGGITYTAALQWPAAVWVRCGLGVVRLGGVRTLCSLVAGGGVCGAGCGSNGEGPDLRVRYVRQHPRHARLLPLRADRPRHVSDPPPPVLSRLSLCPCHINARYTLHAATATQLCARSCFACTRALIAFTQLDDGPTPGVG